MVIVVVGVVILKVGGNKKLIIILVVVLVLVLVGGGVLLLMKKKVSVDEGDDGDVVFVLVVYVVKKESGKLLVFVLLDLFIVNLMDKDVDCFVQVGVILQVDDEKVVEEIKKYFLVICSNVLMVFLYKLLVELLMVEGKEKFVCEIMCELVWLMGIELDDEDEDEFVVIGDVLLKKKKKKCCCNVESLVIQVLFFQFIVQ